MANERVQINAAGQVVLRLKTPLHDSTTHLVMSPRRCPRFFRSDVSGSFTLETALTVECYVNAFKISTLQSLVSNLLVSSLGKHGTEMHPRLKTKLVCGISLTAGVG